MWEFMRNIKKQQQQKPTKSFVIYTTSEHLFVP